jgi:uncharacterized membrane protein
MEAVVHSIVINRPIEEVFDVATCQQRCMVWRGPIVAAEKTSDGPVDVGATYRHQVKFLGVTVEANPVITLWQPPHRAEVESTSGPATYHLTFTCEATPDGTKLTTTIEAELRGAFNHVPDILVHRAISRQHASDLESFKEMMESGTPISV